MSNKKRIYICLLSNYSQKNNEEIPNTRRILDCHIKFEPPMPKRSNLSAPTIRIMGTLKGTVVES